MKLIEFLLKHMVVKLETSLNKQLSRLAICQRRILSLILKDITCNTKIKKINNFPEVTPRVKVEK